MSSYAATRQVDPEEFYIRQNQIGKGSFGKVYKGFDKRTKQPVAIKIIDLDLAEDEIEDIELEIKILSQLNSPHITKYYGTFSKGSELWIVMEYCLGGSCADLLLPGAISEPYIAIIIKEVLKGLEYLHDENKLHRDIKSANLLVTASGEVKMADFGVSGQLTATQTKKNSFVGTPFWMAPEVIRQSGYNNKADIWSLGITAIELATQRPPHSELHPMKLTGNFSKAFKDFVGCCLQMRPEDRASAKELLKHRFLKNVKKTSYLVDLIERHQIWTAQHGGNDSDAESDTEKKQTVASEVAWDFGTVKHELPSEPEVFHEEKDSPKIHSDTSSLSSYVAPKHTSDHFAEGVATVRAMPTVYTGIIHPVLKMLSQESQQLCVTGGIDELNSAFSNLEKIIPGFSQRFLLEAFEKLTSQQ
ncbi:hypothetical protein DSO57_1019779 [Entomophthora muscae]|uniref:Uncharacterized protein n=1 Tax=Entomophthora muscae TaxID=34485 RepID=A0ACC2UDF5_9FUNG|nr:hypothetical protein DSO57_1019779 [Entomophthora muscae]